MSALLFAMAVYTPGRTELNELVPLRTAAMQTTNSTLLGLAGNPSIAAQVEAQNASFVGLGDPTKKWISTSGIVSSLQNATALQASQLQP